MANAKEPAADAPPAAEPKGKTNYTVFRVDADNRLSKVGSVDAWSRQQAAEQLHTVAGRYAVAASANIEVFEYGVPETPPLELRGRSGPDVLAEPIPDVVAFPGVNPVTGPGGDIPPIQLPPQGVAGSGIPDLLADEGGPAADDESAAEGQPILLDD